MVEPASPERYHEANHDGAYETCRRCQRAKAICRSKRLYDSYEAADVAVLEINEGNGYTRAVVRYRCRWCLLWHVTTARTKVRVKRAERQRRKWIIARSGSADG